MRVYLAPHHDDILLSLPARLLAQGSSTDNSIVVVFSDESLEMETTCSRLHRELGIDVSLAGFSEAIRRGVSLRACLRSTRTLRDIQDDYVDLDDVTESLYHSLAQVRPAEVVAPLLPIHIDHALLRAAAERLNARGSPWRLLYYEDHPYSALWPQSLAREAASLIKLEAGYKAIPEEAVESLFQKLQAVVQQRDLERILKHRKSRMPDDVEPLWSARASGE